MDLKHEFTVPATLDETWAAFNDIESVAECFPGAQVTSSEGDTFQGTVKVKLGPIALVYNGSGTFTEKDEANHRMVIAAKGKDKRGNGTAGADVVAQMTDVGGATRVEVTTDLSITGKPAQFGRGVIQDVSDKLLGQFTACLEQKVGSTEEVEDAAPDPADVPAETPVVDPEARRDDAEERMGNIRSVPAAEPAPQVTTSAPPPDDDALDLGATVLPILVKSYWRQALGVVVVLLVLRRLLRR